MKHETKIARGVIERADAIEARAMRQNDRADERYAEARKLRDQWKFAKILTTQPKETTHEKDPRI